MNPNFNWTSLEPALRDAVQNDENGVYSPASFTTMLRMLAIQNPDFAAEINRCGIDVVEPIRSNEFVSVNSVWYQQDEITPSSATLAGLAHFDATLEGLNFREDSLNAARVINAATKKNTKGILSELMEEKNLAAKIKQDEIILLYLNTLFYKGAWDTAFDPLKTYEGKFKTPQGEAKASYMVSKEKFNIFPEYHDICTATWGNSMKTQGDLFCAFLPKPGVSLEKLLERLAGGIGQFETEEYEIHLPKFSIEANCILSKLFPQLVPTSMPGFGLSQTPPIEVFQKAMIKIDEIGVEAAAATAAMMGRSMTRQVYFNRPFVIAIIDNRDQPVFAAVVNNPGFYQ